jgi:hypothetical protein
MSSLTSTTSSTTSTPSTTTVNIFEVGTVTNAVWNDSTQTEINCIVTFPNNPLLPSTGIPFNARSDDTEPHGAQLFAALVAGTYGTIGAYVPPVLTPQQQYTAAISSGIVLTSTSTPALNGTYGVATTDQANISSEALFISTFQEFSTDTDTMGWADSSGAIHTFPNTTLFMAFAKASAQYVSACKQALITLTRGGTATFPSNAITIA